MKIFSDVQSKLKKKNLQTCYLLQCYVLENKDKNIMCVWQQLLFHVRVVFTDKDDGYRAQIWFSRKSTQITLACSKHSKRQKWGFFWLKVVLSTDYIRLVWAEDPEWSTGLLTSSWVPLNFPWVYKENIVSLVSFSRWWSLMRRHCHLPAADYSEPYFLLTLRSWQEN